MKGLLVRWRDALNGRPVPVGDVEIPEPELPPTHEQENVGLRARCAVLERELADAAAVIRMIGRRTPPGGNN